jgi:hypothetical protein
MPRDKRVIHRATSDVEEDNDVESGEEPDQETKEETKEEPTTTTKSTDVDNLIEERKKYLRDIILKRTSDLKQQRERSRQQRFSSDQRP